MKNVSPFAMYSPAITRVIYILAPEGGLAPPWMGPIFIILGAMEEIHISADGLPRDYELLRGKAAGDGETGMLSAGRAASPQGRRGLLRAHAVTPPLYAPWRQRMAVSRAKLYDLPKGAWSTP